jgi:threonine dehydratase
MQQTLTTPTLNFAAAKERLQKVVNRTPLTYNHNLSRKYQCDVFLKREDLQVVRSYKLRGAYNMMSSLTRRAIAKRCGVCKCRKSCTGFCL